MFARGGSGAQRTLEAMDWHGLDPKAGMPPKVLAGYSDVTAVLEAAVLKAAAVRLGNEEDYRTDRMLTQSRRSGYLDGVAGIVAGTFTGCGPPEAIQDILAERLGSLKVPMIVWANVGDGGLFQTFPYGIAAELDADAATLRLLDPPLS
ncbi:MAG: LD-carboxypeptidase [Streptosporangiaceae bacterium]